MSCKPRFYELIQYFLQKVPDFMAFNPNAYGIRYLKLLDSKILFLKAEVRRSFNTSQLPRLATGRVAVTNGYSHRMFC